MENQEALKGMLIIKKVDKPNGILKGLVLIFQIKFTSN